MIINVLVEQRVNKNDQLFSYLVPNSLIDKIEVGKRVLIPFNNQKIEGFIMDTLTNEKEFDYELKEIIDVIDENPVLNREMIELGQYMSNLYLAPLISCYQTMLPVALKAKNKTSINIKLETYIVLNQDENEIKKYLKYNKIKSQHTILSLLLKEKKCLKKEFKSASSLKTLISKGLIKETKKEVYRLDSDIDVYKKVKLTDEQVKVVKEIINSKEQKLLLHGVTGSGKTEVYMEVIEHVINNGQTAIVLVPEISLTTQLASRFKSRFQEKVAILHSRLSAGEKYDEWRKIERGEVSIVIGARSAVFAPLSNIGVIIIDEEHETTYKQENNPRYHTIDIAGWRINRHQAKLVLGGATPSLDSYARARKGLYQLVELTKRVNQKELPKVHIIDMNNSIKKGFNLFSSELIQGINKCLEKKEQIIILLNRRGYANYITCQNCGYTYKCPDCDITLTYHKTSDFMRCHYCGYATKKEVICPQCQERKLTSFGVGTERIEEELKKQFSGIRVIRMDLDTTTKKNSHQRIIKDFNEYKYDLLLGTQMIAKGLDFPQVTLVGVLNSDIGLNVPDFRSSERTFQLLSQVAGRSGRSQKAGEVIIQTFNPQHYVMGMVKKHDYTGFYQKEILLRKKLNYPPFCFLVLIKIITKDYEYGSMVANKIGKHLRKHLLSPNHVLGPTMANPFKVKKLYHFQFIIKYRLKDEIKKQLAEIITHYQNDNKIKIEIDFQPYKL